MNRRTFLATGAALAVGRNKLRFNVADFDRTRILANAQHYLLGKPLTVTAAHSPRSAGGLHDYFSEGDYWWPDPANPDGPYIQRDGMTNPDNFVDHRQLLMRLSVQAPALTAAWSITHDQRYADQAAAHIRAWFVDEATRMNPDLQYAQAVHGHSTGRGTGIIDTIHLVEVARAIPALAEAGSLSAADYKAVRDWFSTYLTWLTTSKNGMEERDAPNNHGTCWLMQVASFAKLTGNTDQLAYVISRFKKVIVPGQIDPDGGLPLEMKRTKPYSYCLFNLEALATICQLVSESADNLWSFATSDGRSVANAIAFMYPFVLHKDKWPMHPDVMYFTYWPMRQAFLLFGALAYQNNEYLDLWKKLPADSTIDEVVRNFFIRQPVLWV